jgi:3-oxoadipate enol-lactonase
MDLRDAITSITAQTLVIAGADDPATLPEHGRLIADLIPGARFEVISPAAHLATIERPDLTTAMILRFLSEAEEGSDR